MFGKYKKEEFLALINIFAYEYMFATEERNCGKYYKDTNASTYDKEMERQILKLIKKADIYEEVMDVVVDAKHSSKIAHKLDGISDYVFDVVESEIKKISIDGWHNLELASKVIYPLAKISYDCGIWEKIKEMHLNKGFEKARHQRSVLFDWVDEYIKEEYDIGRWIL